MKGKKVCFTCVLFIAIASQLFQPAWTSEKTVDFYTVSGQQILDPSGQPVILKGLSMSNGLYSTPESINDFVVENHHDAYSYYELAEMGMDHVRFEVNYHLFESDENPYVYKSDGFELIDRNLDWAKAAGIDMIIQIKWPQGGFQAQTDIMKPSDIGTGNGGKCLWMDIDSQTGEPLTTENYKENQKRLVALWTTIAKRYANEPAIIGYNLINEPVVPQKESKEATVAQLQDLFQRIADGIRSVDQNHILFVEQLIGWFDPNDPTVRDYDYLDTEDTFCLIDDGKTVYEFHFYEPMGYTHQGADWLTQYPAGVVYPSHKLMRYEVENWNPRGSVEALLEETDGQWSYFESEPFTAGENASREPYNLAQLQLAAYHTPQNDSIWFDDLTVTCTDSQGKTTTLYSYDFSDGLGQFEWGGIYDQNGTGRFDLDIEEGHNAPGSLRVVDTSGANLMDISSEDWFYLEADCTYQISGWVKNSKGGQYPQASLIYAENVYLANFDYVECLLQDYLTFGEKHNVPMYVGEWGLHYASFENGAEAYIQDISKLFEQYGLGSNYYAYRDDAFGGLYLYDEWEAAEQRNDFIHDLLTRYYGTPVSTGVATASFESGAVTAYVNNPCAARLAAVLYEENGCLAEMVCTPVTLPETLEVKGGTRPLFTLKLSHTQLEEGQYIKLFLLEESTGKPLSAVFTVEQ